MRVQAAAILLIVVAISASAAGSKPAEPPVDYELRVVDRPVIQRVFMPDSSARSIAVGLTGGLSYCFDTEGCSVRYAWSGGFLDMKPTWHARGARPPVLRGRKFFVSDDASGWRSADGAEAVVRFRGYALVKGLPEFRFDVANARVTQRVNAAADGGLTCAFQVTAPPAPLEFHPPAGVTVRVEGREHAGGLVKVPSGQAVAFEIQIPSPAKTSNER